MSEHKYNEAYSKGYRDGQKDQCLADAIDDALVMLGKLEVTNGDMIQAMFPNATFIIDEERDEQGARYSYVYTDDFEGFSVDLDWWNAPYKEAKDE